MDRNSQFLRIYANLPLNQRNEIIVVLDDEELTWNAAKTTIISLRSEEHTSELQSHSDLVCRLLLEKKKKKNNFDSYKDRRRGVLLEKYNHSDRLHRAPYTDSSPFIVRHERHRDYSYVIRRHILQSR